MAGFHASGSGIKMYMATDKDQYSKAERFSSRFLLNPDPRDQPHGLCGIIGLPRQPAQQKLLPFNFNIATGEIDLQPIIRNRSVFFTAISYIKTASRAVVSSGSVLPVCRKNGTQVHIDAFMKDSFIAESPNNILLRCRDENQNHFP